MKNIISLLICLMIMISCRQHSSVDNNSVSDSSKTIKSIENFTIENNDSLSVEFSRKWKADMLGENGFRYSVLTRDSIHRLWLINGKSILGYSMQKVKSTLGNPNSQGRGKEDKNRICTFEYLIRRKKGQDKISLLILFNKKNIAHIILERIVN